MTKKYVMNDKFEVTEEPDLFKWARQFESSNRVVKKSYPADHVEVSTVFLGLDHSFGDGPPLIFETLVFGGPLADEMERYSTHREALAGHDAMVERVNKAMV